MSNITDLHPTPEAEAKQELADIGEQVFHGGKEMQGFIWISWEEDGIDWGSSLSESETLQAIEVVKFAMMFEDLLGDE